MIHLAVLLLLYFLPTIIAHNRGHEITGILLFNLLLWLDRHRLDRDACSGRCSPPPPQYRHPYYHPYYWR